MLTPQSVTPTAAQRSDFLRLVFLQLARLEPLAVVLGGGDLPRAEADTERGGADPVIAMPATHSSE